MFLPCGQACLLRRPIRAHVGAFGLRTGSVPVGSVGGCMCIGEATARSQRLGPLAIIQTDSQ